MGSPLLCRCAVSARESSEFALAPVLPIPPGMRTLLGALATGLLLAACGVGDDPVSDDRNENLGIDCNATFTTAGTWTAAAPARPADVPTGCWPVGTWTFTAKVDTNECAAPPALLPSYSFKVDRAVNPDPTMDIGYVETYTWFGDQALLFKLAVSETGSGCEGGLELYSVDGMEYWNMKPLLQDNGTVAGFGEYAHYTMSQK
jgi:hypothetical protein